LEQGFDRVSPHPSTAAAMQRGVWATFRAPCLAVGARMDGDTEGVSGRADSGRSVVPLEADGGSWLRGGSRSVLDWLGMAGPTEAFSTVEVSLNTSEPWQAARSSPGAKARVGVVAAVPPLSVMLPSNLIKGTLTHVRAKVMNERSAAAVEEYTRTAGRWGSLVEVRAGG
jgi:hypothetical protein